MAPIRFGVMLVLSVAGNTGCLKATPAMHDASSLPDPKSSKSGSGARDAVDSTPGPANPGGGRTGQFRRWNWRGQWDGDWLTSWKLRQRERTGRRQRQRDRHGQSLIS
jgi:hypothetical protein